MSFARLFVEVWDALDGSVITLCSHATPIVLGCLALRVIYLLWFHPLSNIPGPRIAAISDLWKTYAVLRARYSSSLHALHAQYGDAVRIGPNEVSIVSPEEVKYIYGHKSGYMKGPFYDVWRLLGKTHFNDRDEVTHRRGLQRVSGAYSLKHLTSLERYCDTCTHLLLRHLDKTVESGCIIDLSKFIEMYAYDSVSGIGFGKNLGLLERGEDTAGIINTMAAATRAMAVLTTLTSFSWIWPIKPLGWLTSKIMGTRGPGFFRMYGTRYVKERQALRNRDRMAYEDGKDMLYRFLESRDPATSMPLDTGTVISNCISIIVAGADTTRASMVAFLRYVYAHPPTLQRLREELDAAMATGHLTFPITYSQASRLEFSWACMKEAMRLHPAVGMTLQRVVPAGGRVIGGRFYPAGTLVGMSPREVQYDARAYGKDAAEWRPERWLEEDRSKLERYSLVFGQGTRVCLGKNLSLMEMSKLLPTIVYHYDIRMQNPEKPWNVSESWFALQYDFFCSVAKREC